MLSTSGSRSRLSASVSLPTLAEAPAEAAPALPSSPRHRSEHGVAATEYVNLLALVDLLREVDGSELENRRRQRQRRTARLEDALLGLARSLHTAEAPAWRLQDHLQAAARGVGLWPLAVHVFPHHVTFTLSSALTADSAGAKTLSVATTPGLDVFGLAAADALARRLSSFAITSEPGAASVARNGEAVDEAAVAAALAALAPRWRAEPPAAIAAAALDLAAKGPGFFHDGDESGSESSSEEEDEESTRLLSRRRPRTGEAAEDGEDGPAACRRAAFVSAALDEVLPALKALEAAPSLYSALSQCVASAVAAAGCALVFWQASWYDGSLAAACGGAVALLGLLFSGSRWGSRPGLRRVAGYELCAAALVSFLSRVAMHVAATGATPAVCSPAVRLGAMQWLLQGWDITEAIVEIVHRTSAVVGASHLLTALTITAMIGFGFDLGDALADICRLRRPEDGGAACSSGVSPHLYLPIFVPSAAALCVQMNASAAQAPLLMCIALATLALTLYVPGPAALNLVLAAIAAGWLANQYANRTGRPAVGGAAIGVFVLVPDGMAELNGIGAVMMNRAETSLSAGLTLTASILQSAVAIAAGVFLSTLLLAPRELSRVSAAHHRTPPPAGSRLMRLRTALEDGARRRRHAYARSRALPLFF